MLIGLIYPSKHYRLENCRF